jgi:hypothetical protein
MAALAMNFLPKLHNEYLLAILLHSILFAMQKAGFRITIPAVK